MEQFFEMKREKLWLLWLLVDRMCTAGRAIEFAVDVGFSRLIIKGDNNNVFHAISSSVEDTSLFGNVVGDIRHLIRGLHWSSVCYIRRGGNRVAHALAQYARHTLDEDLYWMEDSPPPAMDALYHDLLSI